MSTIDALRPRTSGHLPRWPPYRAPAAAPPAPCVPASHAPRRDVRERARQARERARRARAEQREAAAEASANGIPLRRLLRRGARWRAKARPILLFLLRRLRGSRRRQL